MNIIDTHCHYNMDPLYENWREHWQRAQEHGVVGALIVGTNIETSKRSVEIAAQDEHLYPVVGVHPYVYTTIAPQDLPTQLSAHASVLSMLLKQHPIVGIGETGLDYFRLTDENREVAIYNQQQALRMHIALANEFHKPLILHVRDKEDQAYWDALELLKKEYTFDKPFILHCVSGPTPYIEEALNMGAYIGVAGNVTYPSADPIRNLVKLAPNDRILSETDAPYLPPKSHRGKECEPWMITETVEFLETLGKDAEQIHSNARTAFGI